MKISEKSPKKPNKNDGVVNRKGTCYITAVLFLKRFNITEIKNFMTESTQKFNCIFL